MTDYAGMSKDELLAANQELMQRRGQVVAEIEAEQIALSAELDKAIASERLASEVASMPQGERDALMEVLSSAPPYEPPVAEGETEETEEMVITEGDVAEIPAEVVEGGGE